jgi:hypothetical protein
VVTATEGLRYGLKKGRMPDRAPGSGIATNLHYVHRTCLHLLKLREKVLEISGTERDG